MAFGAMLPCFPRPSIAKAWSGTLQRRDVVANTLRAFDQEHCIDHLEHEMRGDLARLAQKYSQLITSLEDIEELRVREVDGDHMAIEVVYCDHVDETCVALDVPIEFPRHVDTEAELDDLIHELEMPGADAAAAAAAAASVAAARGRRKAAAIDPALAETMTAFAAVMNESFQRELSSFARAFGGPAVPRGAALDRCEMVDLEPDGFRVRTAVLAAPATESGSEPARMVEVAVSFGRQCLSAAALQQELLRLSEQALLIAADAPAPKA